MWFSKTHVLQDLVAALKAENSDLRAQVRFLTQSAHDRETKLIDRILAVTVPTAHREIHPPPPRPPRPNGGEQGRVNFPGSGMLPPPLPRPPGVAGIQMQGSSEAERRVHTPEDGGSNPSPAPSTEGKRIGTYWPDNERTTEGVPVLEDEHPTHPPPIEDETDG